MNTTPLRARIALLSLLSIPIMAQVPTPVPFPTAPAVGVGGVNTSAPPTPAPVKPKVHHSALYKVVRPVAVAGIWTAEFALKVFNGMNFKI